jgi:hypothetical protein
MKICVVSPKCSSVSAKALADILGADYRRHGDGFNFGQYDAVFNYGSSARHIYPPKVINSPAAVALCVNKISTLKRVSHGIEWTQDKAQALKWMEQDDYVVCRETQVGSRSKGIIIASTLEDFEAAPASFWTRYFGHDHEVRINIFRGKILTVYEKVVDETGEFFSFNLMEVTGEHHQVDEMIQSITNNIGIDFYGMDILVNSEGTARLLEVNSGPSLMQDTADVLIPLLEQEFAK